MTKVAIVLVTTVVLVSANNWQQKKSKILPNARDGVQSRSYSSSSGKWTDEGDKLKLGLRQTNELKMQAGTADGYGTAGSYGSVDNYGTVGSYGSVDGYGTASSK